MLHITSDCSSEAKKYTSNQEQNKGMQISFSTKCIYHLNKETKKCSSCNYALQKVV